MDGNPLREEQLRAPPINGAFAEYVVAAAFDSPRPDGVFSGADLADAPGDHQQSDQVATTCAH